MDILKTMPASVCPPTESRTDARQQVRAARSAVPAGSQGKVAYIVSRFPKLTETFVLFEILAVLEAGIDVEVFPLLQARNTSTHPEAGSVWKKAWELMRRPASAPVMHAEVEQVLDRVHLAPLISWHVLAAQLWFLRTRPITYLSTLWSLFRATWGSANYCLGGLILFPKAAYLARRLPTRGVTHVHAHFANHATTVAYVVRRLSGIPFSFTAHGSDIQVDQHMLAEKVSEASYVLTISEYNRRFLLETCDPQHASRIQVLRCGVDTRVFQHNRKPVDGDEKIFRVVCVGTLYPVKGQAVLLRACKQLLDEGVPVECQLVGDGPDREMLVALAQELEVDGAVKFLGQQPRSQVATLLRDADVLVAPSVPTKCGRREGIPVVLMEAMASGIPVVASNISGIPELVKHGQTGLLVEPDDAGGLADSIRQLAKDDDLRSRLSRSGRLLVEQEYDLRVNAATVADYFAHGGPA